MSKPSIILLASITIALGGVCGSALSAQPVGRALQNKPAFNATAALETAELARREEEASRQAALIRRQEEELAESRRLREEQEAKSRAAAEQAAKIAAEAEAAEILANAHGQVSSTGGDESNENAESEPEKVEPAAEPDFTQPAPGKRGRPRKAE